MADGYVHRLGRYLAQRRDELRMSQEDLAKASGVPRGTIAAIENERIDNAPRLDTIEKLAKGLRIPCEKLVLITRGVETDERYEPGLTQEEIKKLAAIYAEMDEEQRQNLISYAKWMQSERTVGFNRERRAKRQSDTEPD